MIGTAFVADQYPLYYEAVNEKGLGVAGLNFEGNAHYFEESADKDNISPFELIPWILSQCETTADARVLLEKINLVNIPFSEQLPLSPLHWIIADKDQAITVESVAQQRGLCNLGDGKYEITIYTSCFNTRTGVQYYNCYDNHQISKVDMHKEDLDGKDLVRYPLITEEQIHVQN